MVVGKTSSSISKTEIFNCVTESQVLTAVFPQITSVPCLMCSPIRPDRKPSFSIYLSDGGHIYYKDFASGERGSLLDLLCQYWQCNLNQTLDKISQLFIEKKDIAIKPKQIRILTRKESSSASKIQVTVRPWHDYDYAYWESYGISKKWLRYGEIYPISHKIVTKEGKKYIFPADRYAYCFVERKEGNTQLKIYQPFNKNGFKWCSKMDSSVIGLWTKIPEEGKKVVICSSLKDALCISCQLGIPALCLQGEGYNMSDTAVNELKRRYKKVFICFDVDEPGKKDSKKLAKQTGFINVIPDLGKEKDFSDYYKSLENKEDFKLLKQYFE